MKYNWDIAPEVATADTFDTGHYLATRGITTPAARRRYLTPHIADLHDPFLMADMHQAIDRLQRAIERQERIMVYGDYDVDGATAVALVYQFLLPFYDNVSYYIPDRFDEGYGVSRRAVDYAAESGVRLIIILDCGIKAHDEIAYARSLGVDFIVCDHHEQDDTLPPAAAVLNPKRHDDHYPCHNLSGCAVGFKFMQAFAATRGIPLTTLLPYTALCAISIAADLVPMTDENRTLATLGLAQLNTILRTEARPSAPGALSYAGIKALLTTAGIATSHELTTADIVHRLAPRLNAAGRMECGRVAVDLLVEHDPHRATALAKQLDEYNKQRRDIDHRTTEQALAKAREAVQGAGDTDVIVIASEKWNKGVVGIVAARVAEAHRRPAIVLTRDDTTGLAVGSARSADNFNFYDALRACDTPLTSFGGHSYACGMSLPWDDIAAFTHDINAYAHTHAPANSGAEQPTLHIDAVLPLSAITRDLLATVRTLEPFGPGNQKPVFCSHNVYDFGTSKVVGRDQEHIKLELVDTHSPALVGGIAFGQSEAARYIKSRQPFDIAYTLEENAYRPGTLQLQIIDIHY